MDDSDDARLVDSGNGEWDDGRLQAVVRSLIAAAGRIPGLRVNRESYLRDGFSHESAPTGIDIDLAIETNPIDAGVPIEFLDKQADSAIRNHLLVTAGASAVTGLPGGLAMAATIPVDLAQFYWHALVCSQKLAYLYGWPDLFPEGELQLDEETEGRLILILGSLHGVVIANKVLGLTASQFGKGAAKYVPRMGLAESWYYPLVKKVAEQVGIKVTRQSFGRGVAKLIPVAGAVASAGVTAITFRQMTRDLKKHLRDVALEGPPDFVDSLGSDDEVE